MSTCNRKSDAEALFCRARKVPFALQDQIKKDLAKLEARGIIQPVEHGGVRNALPVVWQIQKDGSVRLCADYEVHIKDKLSTNAHTLPDTVTLVHKLNGAKSSSAF